MFLEGDLTVTHSSEILVSMIVCLGTRITPTFVGDHDIVNPDVVAPDVDAVETALITTTNSHVVNFTVRAGVDGEVEGRRVDQGNVVNRPVGDVPNTQQAGTRCTAGLVDLVAITLNGTLSSRREHLEAAPSQ